MTLSAEYIYPFGGTNLPIVVFMHGMSGSVSDFTTEMRERLASYNIFCLFVEMRGRGSSGGDADCGAREIQDIIDAVEYVKVNFVARVDVTQIHVVGYSGGGGNALSCASKFPDYFNTITSLFGVSDYGHDATDGWYQTTVSSRTAIVGMIGDTPINVPDAYHARASILAITNYTTGLLRLFHDEGDSSVPIVNSQNVADAMDAAGLTNYDLSITTSEDTPRWTHGYPTTGSGAAQAESVFMPAIVNKTYVAWTVPESSTLQVTGYLVTKRFSLWLGDGTSEFGQVVYDMTTRTFTITADTGAADWTLTLKNQTPSSSIGATINSVGDTQTSDSDGNVTFTGSII